MKRNLAIFLILISFIYLWWKSAWTSDDAYISFRVVENFLDGNGLTWDPRERVQAFTNPLWVLLLACFRWIDGRIDVVAAVISFFASVLALFAAAAALPQSRPGTLVAGFVMVSSSRTFMDATSSGLETPLTIFLVSTYLFVFGRDSRNESFVASASLAGLLLVQRLDLAALAVIPLLSVMFQRDSIGERRAVQSRFLALVPLFLPVMLWTVFSIVYYGSALPNTYFAKLPANLPMPWRIGQGAFYLYRTASYDPIGAFLVVCGAAAPWFFGGEVARYRAWSIAVIADICVVVLEGGDFMIGRMVAGIVLPMATVAGVALEHMKPMSLRRILPAATIVVCVAAHLSVPQLPWRYTVTDGQAMPIARNITDERGLRVASHHLGLALAEEQRSAGSLYAMNLGLKVLLLVSMAAALMRMAALAIPSIWVWATGWSVALVMAAVIGTGSLASRFDRSGWPGRTFEIPTATSPLRVQPALVIGNTGYYLDGRTMVLDVVALADPLLSRLPAEGEALVGHFRRPIPLGYLESLSTGENRIVDPVVHIYYDRIQAVTRQPVWSLGRLKQVVHLVFAEPRLDHVPESTVKPDLEEFRMN